MSDGAYCHYCQKAECVCDKRTHYENCQMVNGRLNRVCDCTATDNAELANKVIRLLMTALGEIEHLCGGPQSERMKQCRDIYDIARPALEAVDVPSSPLYWRYR